PSVVALPPRTVRNRPIVDSTALVHFYCTRYSQAVTHPSTNRARRCLTSVIGREPVLSTWYGRRHFIYFFLEKKYTSSFGNGKMSLLSALCVIFVCNVKKKKIITKVYCTRYSQAVTHPSTNRARRCLTSVIGREPVLSTWYGRRHFILDLATIAAVQV
ncbi:hypothetical protein ScPMuIL_007327, partial [Solemya velum]